MSQAEELIEKVWIDGFESETLDYLHLLEWYYPESSFPDAVSHCILKHKERTTPISRPLGVVLKDSNVPDVIESYPEYFGGVISNIYYISNLCDVISIYRIRRCP